MIEKGWFFVLLLLFCLFVFCFCFTKGSSQSQELFGGKHLNRRETVTQILQRFV